MDTGETEVSIIMDNHNKREIGGYQDFEEYHGIMLHDDGIKLNCGRNCLAYLIEARNIKRICLPYYICDSVINLCRKYDLDITFFHIGQDFKPEIIHLEPDRWLYLVNYYGQLSEEDILQLKKQYHNIIVDNAQAYYDKPVKSIDTLYTCRKFFGVPDGAILYTNRRIERPLDRDESYTHMAFLMGRYERTASEFYKSMVENNHRFIEEPIKWMSKLTENILHSIDYEKVLEIRNANYMYLSENLEKRNLLKLKQPAGAFAYPLMVENAEKIREKLIKNKVYVPTLWPNVLVQTENNTTEYKLASNVLPLPCDQRYGIEEMKYIVSQVI